MIEYIRYELNDIASDVGRIAGASRERCRDYDHEYNEISDYFAVFFSLFDLDKLFGK